MVESAGTQAASMAAVLPARNRWCVTGTPCSKGLNDLFGLVHFLHIYPYSVSAWWSHAMRQLLDMYTHVGADSLHLSPLFSFLERIFWRTEKQDVLDELHIPTQLQETASLRLNPIERYFYERLNEECCEKTLQLLAKRAAHISPSTPISDFDRKQQAKVLAPLLHLRQACCHPHVAKGGHLLKSSPHDMGTVLSQV